MFIDTLFRDPTFYFTVVGVVIVSIVLHELGHALVATWQGDPTPKALGHLTWNPLVHMGWFSILAAAVVGIAWGRTPVQPRNFRNKRWGDVMVSFAGPAVNLLLAFIGAFMLVVVELTDGPDFARQLWHVITFFNLLLLLFNMIPVPPLDGFTVVTRLFRADGYERLMGNIGMFGLIIAIVIVNSGPFHGAIRVGYEVLVTFWALVLSPFFGGGPA